MPARDPADPDVAAVSNRVPAGIHLPMPPMKPSHTSRSPSPRAPGERTLGFRADANSAAGLGGEPSGRRGPRPGRTPVRTLALGWALLALWIAGCDPKPTAAQETEARAQTQVRELIEVYTPLDRTVTTDVKDAIVKKQIVLLDACSKGGVAVGHAALAALKGRTEPMVEVERALLTVGARAATDEALPLLEALVTQYGAQLSLRTEAVLLLAEVRPQRAIELLEPIVTKKQNMTMPPSEFLVQAWVVACEKTGRSPVPELADVATNLFQEEAARVRAVRELGKHKVPAAEAALRAIVVESTGDGYLRRIAVQSLHEVLPAETACALFEQVASKEADMNFLKFLSNVLDTWCGR